MNRAQRRAQKKKHKPPVSYPTQPADIPYEQRPHITSHNAEELRQADRDTRRKQLLAELAALENA